jgi:hypothetical protein
MHHSRTILAGGALLLAVASALFGCHAGSVCNPPGATSGEIVSAESSEAYRVLISATDGGDAPHMACRAEAVIPSTVVLVGSPIELNPVDPSEQGRNGYAGPRTDNIGHSHNSKAQAFSIDPRLYATPEHLRASPVEYRVLGVGRGVDQEDCGKTALQACNDAVDAYCKLARMDRPLNIICQLAQDQEYCRP